MTIPLKYNTASQEVPLGPFLDDADGKTAETGLTIANTDIKLWKSGATTLANKNSGGATHISGGIYYAVLDATDTGTKGAMVIFVSVSGALPVRVECEVLDANYFDARYGDDRLQVDVREKGDSTLALTTQEKADVNAEVDSALNTAIPGSPTADSVNERLVTLDNAYTAARAAYLDNVNNANLATVPAITAARIGYLDNINNSQLLNISSTILGRIDAAISTRSSHAAADVWSVGTRALTDKANFTLASAEYANIRGSVCATGDPANSIGKILYDLYNTRLTSTRAGYLDNVNNANLATVPAITSARIAYLDNINNAQLLNISSTILGRIDAAITTRSSHTAADVWSVGTRALTDKDGFRLSATGVDDILDEACEGSYTLRQMLRIYLAALAGKSSNYGSTFRDAADSKNRIVATTDADGNRTAITTLDGT